MNLTSRWPPSFLDTHQYKMIPMIWVTAFSFLSWHIKQPSAKKDRLKESKFSYPAGGSFYFLTLHQAPLFSIWMVQIIFSSSTQGGFNRLWPRPFYCPYFFLPWSHCFAIGCLAGTPPPGVGARLPRYGVGYWGSLINLSSSICIRLSDIVYPFYTKLYIRLSNPHFCWIVYSGNAAIKFW